MWGGEEEWRDEEKGGVGIKKEGRGSRDETG